MASKVPGANDPTRCARLRKHLRTGGYERAGDHVLPFGDAVPERFTDGGDAFSFTLRRGASVDGKILIALLDGRAIASELATLAVRARTLPPNAPTKVLIPISAAVRAELEAAAHTAGKKLTPYCASILANAATVAAERRRARRSTVAAVEATHTPTAKDSLLADPDLGELPDSLLAARHGCSRSYVQLVRTAREGVE